MLPYHYFQDYDGEEIDVGTDSVPQFTGVSEDILNQLLCSESRLARTRLHKMQQRKTSEKYAFINTVSAYTVLQELIMQLMNVFE